MSGNQWYVVRSEIGYYYASLPLSDENLPEETFFIGSGPEAEEAARVLNHELAKI